MKILLMTTITLTLVACALPEHKESVNVFERQEFVLPDNWKLINMSDVEFYIPPDLHKQQGSILIPVFCCKVLRK